MGYNADAGRFLGILCFLKKIHILVIVAVADFLLQRVQLSLIWGYFYPEKTSERGNR